MQLPAETRYSKSRRQNALDIISTCNRKGHYYLGLYFLLFLWLFALTGLLLNHSVELCGVLAEPEDIEVREAGTDLHRDRRC